MTSVWNSEFNNYVNFLKNEGQGSGYNKAFNHTTISVNLEGLRDNLAQFNAARNALGLLSKFTGINFLLTTANNADIRVDNEDASGAYAYSHYQGNTITQSTVNVAKNWVSNWNIGQYGVQTFIHEFGHALGLNHGGPYNGNGEYATDAIFHIDTWQYSAMSYFTQDNYDGASFLFLIGPMIGDIKALNDLYGRLPVNTGDTVYGRGETVYGGWTDFGRYGQSTYCINDTGGIDTMDYSNTSTANLIDLREGYFSNINGYKGNVSIAIGTVIENAFGGEGADTIIGNAVANTLRGNGGADTLYGYDGDDLLYGGSGNDALYGGNGNDSLVGGAGLDQLYGGLGADSFVFTALSDSTVATAGRDIIYDFNYAQGDRIDLRLIDANVFAAGDQAFTFIGTAAFTGVAGQLHVQVAGGNTIVSGDVNGDKVADFAITVAGANVLSSSNYLL